MRKMSGISLSGIAGELTPELEQLFEMSQILSKIYSIGIHQI